MEFAQTCGKTYSECSFEKLNVLLDEFCSLIKNLVTKANEKEYVLN